METEQLSTQQTKDNARKIILMRAAKWNNRRKMAYIALFAMLVVTYWCFFTMPETKIKVLENIISWFYITMGSIVGAYMGFSTLDDKWSKTSTKDKDE